MATADEYAAWIVQNADKKGTPEFDTVAQAYQLAKSEGSTNAAPLSRMEKVSQGLRDPIDGGAQLLTKMLPQGVVNAGNKLNNWLADNTGMVGRLPEGGVDQAVRANEADYQARRKAGGESGFDGYRLIGNVASPANLAVASRVPQMATLGGRVAAGAVAGMGSAALNPVTSGDDFAAEKGKQLAVGGVFGAATPAVTGGIARMISPNASINPQLQLLRNEGVRPTVGQSLGGWANRAEEKLQSVPILGDAISAARQRSGVDLSRAAANRALDPINKKLPDGIVGNDAVLYVRKAMNDAYDDVLPKLSVQQDTTYRQAVGGLRQMVNQGAISPNARSAFQRFMKSEVDPLFQGQKAMTGETFKRLQGKITEQIQRSAGSTDADQRLLSDAYKELGSQLNALSIRTNPTIAPELKAINTGYANFKRLQRAASSVAAEDGAFTPAMLHNAVKAADRSKDKARFAEGGALMQDLSAAGKNLLNNRVPNSGTVDRLLLGGGALGSGLVSPWIPAGLLGGAAMYSAPGQALLRGAVSSRPDLAQPAAQAFRQAAPALIPGGAQLGLGLLQ